MREKDSGQDFDFSGEVALEVVEAVAGGGDELDMELVGRDVDMVESEVAVVDEATLRGIYVVEVRAAGAGDNEVCCVTFDLQVLHAVVMAGDKQRDRMPLHMCSPFSNQRFFVAALCTFTEHGKMVNGPKPGGLGRRL